MTIEILLLCDDNPNHADTILDHISSLISYSRHNITKFNPVGIEDLFFLNFDAYNCLIIHYSLVCHLDNYINHKIAQKISKFNGLKVQFIQDDYRWVDEISDCISKMGIHILFTLVSKEEIHKVWKREKLPNIECITTLAGYIPNRLLAIEPIKLEQRGIDVSYRGRTLPYWLGRLGQDKVIIAKEFLRLAQSQKDLNIDIAWDENSRIYGDQWIELIRNSKVVLGTESGASITDFDGSIEQATKKSLSNNPTATFEEVYQNILYRFENNVKMNVISPRIFEAIALRTPMVLFEGEYLGIIKPWQHYIPLKKDFSNINEIFNLLKNDLPSLEKIADLAFQEIGINPKYHFSNFVKEFDEIIESRIESRNLKTNLGVNLDLFLEKEIIIRQKLKIIRQKLKFKLAQAFSIIWLICSSDIVLNFLKWFRLLKSVTKHNPRIVVKELVYWSFLKKLYQKRISKDGRIQDIHFCRESEVVEIIDGAFNEGDTVAMYKLNDHTLVSFSSYGVIEFDFWNSRCYLPFPPEGYYKFSVFKEIDEINTNLAKKIRGK